MGRAPTTAAQRAKRLHLLDAAEIAALYDRPQFTDEERAYYFTLTPIEVAHMQTFTDGAVQVVFVLQLGYFKAKQRFFSLDLAEVRADLIFILEHARLAVAPDDLRTLNPRTIQQQRQLILEHVRYRHAHAAERAQAYQVVLQAARISPKPQYLLRILLQHCAAERVILPGYTTVQETIIGTAITAEEDRLIAILQLHLTPVDCAALEDLFEKRDGRYRLTLLQRAPKDFSHGQLRQERGRAAELLPLYDLATRVLPHLDISQEGMAYYASLVGYYTATRLNDLNSWIIYVYLLCFLQQRYRRLHDHVLSGFMQAVKAYRDAATAAAETEAAAYRVTVTEDLVRAGQVLQIFTDDQIPPELPFATVQARAFVLLERDRLQETAAYMTTGVGCDETACFWQAIETMARRFKGRLRPLLLSVTLTANRADSPLLEAVTFLQNRIARGRALTQVDPQTIPTRCLPVRVKRYLYTRTTDGATQLLPDRYEFLIYMLLRAALEAGDVCCPQSVRFRSIEDDLIPAAEWQQHKDSYLAATQRPMLLQPITDHLAALEKELEAQFDEVNGRIATGKNTALQITQHGTTRRWSLQTPTLRDGGDHALFEHLPQVALQDVLAFVATQCPCMTAFEHVLGRYTHHTRDDQVLRACLIAWGTNLGLSRMGEISDITTQTLVRASENYLRLETVRAANTQLSDAMAALPLFRAYDIDGVIHSSSDGQKFETDHPTVKAQHSPKYFGLGKGVVSVTLVANHVPVHAELISAHDHESQWVFDLLVGNPTDIQPTIHSTDTHGANQVNFALLKVFGFTFAPRYANIQEKMRTALYGFQHPKHYGAEALFRPVRKLNTALIISQWDEILRIFVSLARKTTTQSVLISKLSSAKRRNRTLLALWEYDHIYRSMHLLGYVDSPQLRQNVQRALNRGEQYHQMKRALTHANAGKLRFGSDEEQALWNECSRLLVNTIVYYNMILLSAAVTRREQRGDMTGAKQLQAVSPVAWIHVNFYGRYTFTEEPAAVPVEGCVEALAQYAFRSNEPASTPPRERSA
jgi:TnpA family transposase